MKPKASQYFCLSPPNDTDLVMFELPLNISDKPVNVGCLEFSFYLLWKTKLAIFWSLRLNKLPCHLKIAVFPGASYTHCPGLALLPC